MDDRAHSRSSSSSSFDSCSDLLISLDFITDCAQHVRSPKEKQGAFIDGSQMDPEEHTCNLEADGESVTMALNNSRPIEEPESTALVNESRGDTEIIKGLTESCEQKLLHSKVAILEGSTDLPKHQPFFSTSAVLDSDCASGTLTQHNLEDRCDLANSYGLQLEGHGAKGESELKDVDADESIQHFVDSIKDFNLHNSHIEYSLSSGAGRPDLEEVDKVIKCNDNEVRQATMQSIDKHGHDHNFCDLPDEDILDGLGFPLVSSELLQLFNVYPSWSSSLNEGRMPYVQAKVPKLLDSLDGHDAAWSGRSEDWKAHLAGKVHVGKEGTTQLLISEEWKLPRLLTRNTKPVDWEEESRGSEELFRYVETLDVDETYIATVLDMEDVLLNSEESRRKFSHMMSNTTNGTPRPSRDGSLNSSTSGTQLFASDELLPFPVDWVEVVGARQNKGSSSFGERMVGVKDHTVYCIKVMSGGQQWEVSRRYRTFVDLYYRLKRMFNARTRNALPSPWEEVESESRKVFGGTFPNIIEVRSSCIEKCLQSLIQAGPPLSTAGPLFWFLRPVDLLGENHLPKVLSPQKSNAHSVSADSPSSPRSETGSIQAELDQNLGKTIKLVVKIHSHRPIKQLLYAQHQSCAGCYKHLEVEKGLMQGFVQTLGWGKPRLCEYTGQLFCASCHLNDTAVLPAYVLQNWDFTPWRVSQLAKAYLDSIYDQPMLCVSAVNPYLYSRVPILSHVKEIRRKLSKILACVHCPSRTRIEQTMGSRKYLLENDDFFALRDLEDLSKGAFAVLPGLLTAVLENFKSHVTKQCSVCQEIGQWCSAGILCEEPFNPIYPFQEENVMECKTCGAVYHQNCFSKCSTCPLCSESANDQIILQAGRDTPAFEDSVHQETKSSLGLSAPSLSDRAVPASSFSQASSSLSTEGQRNQGLYSLLLKSRLWH